MEDFAPINPVPPRSSAVAWSLALVSLCGLLLGYYILQTYFVPKTRQYQLDFGDARWIEPAKPGPTAYFRTEVFLSSAPEQAWLEIAATDNFRVVVNSRTLGVESNVKTRVAGIYDMKKALKAGTNVIAVSIARTSFPGSAQLLVRGLIKERGGEEIPLISDAQWRVTTETGIVRGSADWTSAAVDQELWPKAMPSEIAKNSVPIAWVDLNPLVLQAPLIGSWITSENAASEVTFSTFLQADRFREETWLQIASSGDVDLVINGHLIVTAMDSLSGNKGLPELPPAPHNTALASAARPETIERATAQSAKSAKITSEKAALEISDVSYWIKSGQNSIVATVRADHRPASLLISGFFVRSDGTVHPFATNSDWLAKDRLNASAEPKSQRGVQLGSNGSAPWGYLLQEVAKPIDRTGFTSFIGSCLVLLVTAAATLGLWLFASGFVTKRRRGLLRDVMLRDALFHAPIIVALLLLLLPNYDPRFPGDWSFKPWIVFAAIVGLLAVRCLHFVPAGAVVPKPRIRLPQLDRSLVPYLFLAIIMGLGFGLRFHNLGYISFDHDEMGLIVRSKGIYSLGFPYSVYAGVIRWITTYEAVPYPLALAGLFGYTEWTLRMPACLMGTLCIGIMALLGRRLFNWRTGLIAALVYACLPLDIRWAQNSFYPQQCQFMGLLTIYLFYEAVRFRPLRHGYLTAATVSFCLTYLSWEGSAFLLPSLFIGLLVLRWGEWWWLKEFHLYRCLFFIGAVVIAQYCSRMLAGAPYLQVGSGLSNLIGPSLFFLTPAYQPLFYVYNLWLTENHVFFTVVAIVGLPFCWSHRGFRYVFAMLVSLWILHTNFIAALAPRYAYYYQPLLVLSGVAATVILCEALVALARRESSSAIAILCSQVSAVVLMALLFLTSNDWLFKEYQLSTNGDQPGLMTRMNTYRYDYRGAAHYVSAHYQAGDVVLPGVPHIFAFYAGRPGDYFVDTLLASKVPYNPFLPQPGFIDKFGGLPVLRNLDELKEVTSRARRVWVVAVPIAALDRLNSPAVLEYLDSVGHSVFESYRAKVLLIENQSQIKEERNGGRASVK